MSKKNKKKDIPSIPDLENKYLEMIFLHDKGEMTKDDLIQFMQHQHGKHLAKLFDSEWEILKRKEIIEEWEKEHSTSLALIFENESQKVELEELNQKLREAAIISKKDMLMAATVQKSLLYKDPPETNNFDIAFHFQPLSSVSGDFYDFYVDESNNLKGLVVADVSGHGISSSLITTLAKPIFFRVFRENYDKTLGEILEKINNQLILEIDQADNYITSIVLRFNGDGVEYVNAAHPDLILNNFQKKTCEIVQPEDHSIHGTMLGISQINIPFEPYHFSIKTNDTLVIYTDCLNESQNSDGVEFNEKKIIDTIKKSSKNNSARASLDEIIDSFNKHVGDQPLKDDLTIIVIKKK